MDAPTPSRLPRRVLFAFVGATVVVAIIAFVSGVLPGSASPRDAAGVFLPIYFAVLLAILALSFVMSGNTLMHHYRTGTVQRKTSPGWFWSIVTAQAVVATVLLVIGCLQWSKVYG